MKTEVEQLTERAERAEARVLKLEIALLNSLRISITNMHTDVIKVERHLEHLVELASTKKRWWQI